MQVKQEEINCSVLSRRMSPSQSHFFQPVLPGFEDELSIPVSFFSHLKGKGYEKAVLRSVSGKLWHVKINGRRFEEGWKEFAKFHALHVGDFLVFRHQGDMVFDVMVFDPSACEREYTSFDVKEEVETSSEAKESHLIGLWEKFAKITDQGKFTKKKQIMVSKEKKDHLAFENPYFAVNMTSYTATHPRKSIPRKFAEANGLDNRHCKIALVDQEGRSWLADLSYKKSDSTVFIKNGWSAFCIGNDLKTGDSFIFELIHKAKKPTLKMTGLKRSLKTKRVSSSSTKNAIFSVTMKAAYTKNSQQKIPREFARRNNLNRNRAKMILINERGSSWIVSLAKDSNSHDVYIGRGWSAFAEANGLREGDDMMLQLIKGGENPVMRIFGIKQGTRIGKKYNMKNTPRRSLGDSEDAKAIIELPNKFNI